MAARIPLSVPDGACATPLSWNQEDTNEEHGDQAWIVEVEVAGKSSSTSLEFGKPSDFGRHLCLHRFKLWWLKPSHGHSGVNIPPETQLLLAEHSPSLSPNTSSPGNDTDADADADTRIKSDTAESPQYAALLPISDSHARATLRSGGGRSGQDPSGLAVVADTGDADTPLPDTLGVMLVAVGPDPFRLVRRLVHEAIRRLKTQLNLRDGGAGADGVMIPVEETRVASFVDQFGWCTWDSFYTMVSPEGMLEGLSTLHKGGVRPRWVVIDDGWQRTTNDDALNSEQWDERLVALEANKRFRRFDDKGKVVLDLGETVGTMKRDFGVHQVLAWHAMTGYWAGVEPEAEEMAPFDPVVVKLFAPEGIRKVDPEMQPELDEKRFGMIPRRRVQDFYRAYHTYLKSNGIDGVKVDAQSILDCMGGGNGGVPAVVRAYHEGLYRSVQGTFKEGPKPAALIHCMCHAPSALFHIASVSQGKMVIRGSDDFYPRMDNSHGPHLYTNAYNAILLSNLGLQDWDMFQTALGQKSAGACSSGSPAVERGDTDISNASWFHAAARAISGGPVYVSDRPGQHNTDILNKLVLDDGSVLRASTNAKPTLDCIMRDPQTDGGGLLQIWSLNAVAGTGVVGSFNVRGTAFDQSQRTWVRLEGSEMIPTVKGTVAPSDVHAFNARKISRDRQIDQKTDTMAEGASEEEEYALYLHCGEKVRLVDLREAVEIEVESLGYELATFSRLLELCPPPSISDKPQHQDKAGNVASVRWASIGLRDMFNSSAAVTKQEPCFVDAEGVDVDGGEAQHQAAARCMFSGIRLWVKGSGKFLALASRPPACVCLRDGDGRLEETRSLGDNMARVHGAKLEMSFSHLPEWRGKEGMGTVEFDLPGPWDGKPRRLVVWWE